MIKFPCKYHPDKKTARRCFFCRSYICNQCQKLISHHYFCSYFCVLRFYLGIYKNKLKPKPRELVIIFVILLIQIVFYFVLRDTIMSQLDDGEVTGNRSESATSEDLKFSLDTTFNRLDYRIQISGHGPDNSMIIVQHNGSYRTPGMVIRKKRFSYESAPLFLGENRFVIWGLLTPGKEVLIDSFAVNYFSKKLEVAARSISRVPTKERILALTFDAGSTAFGSDSIIHILNRHNLQATFFLTGRFIKKYPGVVQTLIDNAYELGNHTYSHPHLTSVEQTGRQITLSQVDREYVHNQLNKADSILNNAFHRHFMPYWRAPYGEYNDDILLWAAEKGYRHIRWSDECDTWDYVSDIESSLYRSPDEIYFHLIELEQKGMLTGSIILMHLGSDRQSDFPYQMLSKFIVYMKDRGYRFVTISNLLYTT